MLRFGQEQRPQLLRVQSLLIAGSNGVDTPTLGLCIGLDRWFADPKTTASFSS